MDFSVYGSENAPYVWVGSSGQASWDVSADMLHLCNIIMITTPWQPVRALSEPVSLIAG